MAIPLGTKVLFLETIVLPAFNVYPVLDHEERIEWMKSRVHGQLNGIFNGVYLDELFTLFGTITTDEEAKQKLSQLEDEFRELRLREMINDIRESQIRVSKLRKEREERDREREERDREREREEEREEKERKDREESEREIAERNLAMRNWILSFFFLTSTTSSTTTSNTTAISSHSPSSVLLSPSKSPILQKTSSSFSSSSSLTTEENIDQEDTLDQNNLKDQEISQLRRRKLVK